MNITRKVVFTIGIIYKIENKINHKIYIGKTVLTLEERFQQHILDSHRARCKNRPLYRAFNKYGIKNFDVTVIEQCNTQLLSDREQYWISHYDSYKNGYNATKGGDGKILYNYEEIAQLIKSGMTVLQIMNQTGCCRDTVNLVADMYHIKDILKKEPSNTLKTKMIQSKIKINQYDLDGTFVQTFDSIRSAAKWISKELHIKNECGITSHISDVCKNKRKSAYKFLWSFYNNVSV